MIKKKLLMIKNKTHFFLLRVEKAIQAFSATGVALSVYFLCDESTFLGFVVGVLSFWMAFISIERILVRVFGFQDLRQGVFRSGFWVFLKFFGPMGSIWLGLSYGARPSGVFSGLCYGLVSVAAHLFVRNRFSVNSIE
jgi:hypothetical protein